MSVWRELYTMATGAIARGKVLASYPGARDLVQVQLLTDEVKDRIEHLLPYGRSALPTGGDALLVTVGATRDQVVCIMVDDPTKRINDLGPGEFGDSDGKSCIVFRASQLQIGSTLPVSVKSDAEVYVTAPQVTIGLVGGTAYTLLDSRAMAAYNQHTHSAPSGGGTTSGPSQTMSTGNHTTTSLKAS